MKRPGRLSSARATGWVEEYKGRDIIAGYSKWFAVDPLCALIELRLLGVKIHQGREEQIKASIKARAAQRAGRKKLREQADIGEVHAVPDDPLFIADCAGDYLPDWVCADELQEVSRCNEKDVWCDEKEEVIEPAIRWLQPNGLVKDQRDKPWRQSAVNTVAVPHIVNAIGNIGTVAD